MQKLSVKTVMGVASAIVVAVFAYCDERSKTKHDDDIETLKMENADMKQRLEALENK